MQLSEIIGTMILSPEGENLGYVKEAFLTRDATALSCLVAVDGDEEEFILPARSVLAVKDAIIAGRGRISAPTGAPSPMGRAAFSEHGEYLGAVVDVTLSAAPAIAVLREGTAQTFPLTRVTAGETVIVFDAEKKRRASVHDASKKTRREKPSGQIPSQKRSAPAPKTQPQPQTTPQPQQEASEAQPQPASPTVPNAQPVRQPVRAVSVQTAFVDGSDAFCFNRYDLLGRRVKKSVYDAFGMPVALAGERVTPEMLARARKLNRLLALTVNTITNIP